MHSRRRHHRGGAEAEPFRAWQDKSICEEPRQNPAARWRASRPCPETAILPPMTSRDSASSDITPEVLLRAYACGIFPMAESADDPTLFWVEPEMRGVIPLDGFRIASRLARTVRSDVFTVTVNTAFKAVIAGCAAPQPGRDDTWINKRIRDLYVGPARARALPQRRGLAEWRPGRRPVRRQPRPRVFRREHVSPRPRRLQGGAGASGGAADHGRIRAARHPICHRASAHLSARSRFRGGATPRCSTRRSRARLPISPGCRSMLPSAARGRWRSLRRAGEVSGPGRGAPCRGAKRSVPTSSHKGKWWARRKRAFAHPTIPILPKIPNRPPGAVVAAGAAAVAAGIAAAAAAPNAGPAASAARVSGRAAAARVSAARAPR